MKQNKQDKQWQSGCMQEVIQADNQLKETGSRYEYLVSACLCGIHCRYDGNAKTNPVCMKLYDEKKAFLVCPEVMGGLETPRDPSEFKNGRIVSNKGIDVTEYFVSGAKQCVDIAKSLNIKKAILKEASPSCGVHLIYDGTFTGKKIPGSGMTARSLQEAGLLVMSDEEVQDLI